MECPKCHNKDVSLDEGYSTVMRCNNKECRHVGTPLEFGVGNDINCVLCKGEIHDFKCSSCGAVYCLVHDNIEDKQGKVIMKGGITIALNQEHVDTLKVLRG